METRARKMRRVEARQSHVLPEPLGPKRAPKPVTYFTPLTGFPPMPGRIHLADLTDEDHPRAYLIPVPEIDITDLTDEDHPRTYLTPAPGGSTIMSSVIKEAIQLTHSAWNDDN